MKIFAPTNLHFYKSHLMKDWSVFRQKLVTMRGLYKSRTGQILGIDPLAVWLRAIATDPVVSKILEIGAWEGRGSTRVFAESMLTRSDAGTVSLLSLEASKQRAQRAQKRNAKFPFVQIIWGSIVSEPDLDSSSLSSDERDWISDDIEALKDCPQVFGLIPDSIDALFLDGGEFSTKKEYDLLSDRITKWLILDDTSTRKCFAIANEIRTGATPFKIIVDSTERNGFMIAVKQNGFTSDH